MEDFSTVGTKFRQISIGQYTGYEGPLDLRPFLLGLFCMCQVDQKVRS